MEIGDPSMRTELCWSGWCPPVVESGGEWRRVEESGGEWITKRCEENCEQFDFFLHPLKEAEQSRF